MQAPCQNEFDLLLEQARSLLGETDESKLADANAVINQALTLRPNSVDAWLIKCQIASAIDDHISALAAVEMALRRAPVRAECLYWRGAVLGDLGMHREALRAFETALRVISDAERWMLEDLYYEKSVVLEALGLHDAAVATYEAGLRACPGSALLRTALQPAERARVRSSLTVLRGGQA